MQNKRIVISTNSLSEGGSQRRAVNVANGLAKAGYQVTLLVFFDTPIKYLPDLKVDVHFLYKSREAYKSVGIFKRIKQARSAILIIQPDIIFSFLPHINFFIGRAIKGTNIKHCIQIVNAFKYISFKDKLLEKYNVRHGDRIILQCDEQRKFYPKKLANKIRIIGNPVPLALQNSAPKTITRLERFIMIGRLSQSKNQIDAITAFAAIHTVLPKATLDIFGTGEMHQILEQKIEELQLQDIVTLKEWSDDLYRLLPTYDAFIITSKYEGFPNALIEAQAAGLICFSYHYETGARDLIGPNAYGYLVSGNFSHYLAAIIIKADADLGKTNSLAKAGQEHTLTTYSEKQIITQYINLIDEFD